MLIQISLFSACSVAPIELDLPLLQNQADDEVNRLLVAIQIAPDNWVGYLRLSQYYQARQAWDQAEVCLVKAKEIAPNSIAVVKSLAMIYRIRNQNNKALSLYEEALLKDPQEDELYLERGKFYWSQGKVKAAMQDFKKVLDLNEESFEGHFLMALTQQNQGHRDEAFVHFQKAAKIDPDNAEVWLQLGRHYERMGLQDEALKSVRRAISNTTDQFEYMEFYVNLLEKTNFLEELGRAIKTMKRLYGDDPWVLAHFGHYLSLKDDLPEAEKMLRLSLEKRPQYSWAWFRLGWVLAKQQKYEEAKDAFQKGLKLEPNNSWAMRQLGGVYEAQQRFDLAIEYFKGILSKGEKNPALYIHLAQLYWSELLFDSMVETLQKGLEQFPNNAEILVDLARFYESQKQYDKAREFYLKVYEQYPDDIKIISQLGIIERELGHADKSEIYFQRALALSPDFHWARMQLVSLLLEQKKDDQVEPDLRRFIEDNPKVDWGYGQIALIHYRKKEYKVALDWVRQGMENDPRSSWLRELAALFYEKTGQWHKAKEEYQIALKIKPKDAFLLSHLALAYGQLKQKEKAEQILNQSLMINELDLWSWTTYLLNQSDSLQKKWFGSEHAELLKVLPMLLLNRQSEYQAQIQKKRLSDNTLIALEALDAMFNGERKKALGLTRQIPTGSYAPWLSFQSAYILENNNLSEQALAQYQAVLEQFPHHPWTQARMGVIHELLKNFPASNKFYLAYLEQYPKAVWAWFRVALNASYMGATEYSVEIYQKVLSLDNKHSTSLNNLAWLYLTTPAYKKDQLATALGYAQQAVSIVASEENLDTLAEAYFQSGQLDQAIETIKQAVLKSHRKADKFNYLMKQYQRFRGGNINSPPPENES